MWGGFSFHAGIEASLRHDGHGGLVRRVRCIAVRVKSNGDPSFCVSSVMTIFALQHKLANFL